jgi:hypothetical protein
MIVATSKILNQAVRIIHISQFSDKIKDSFKYHGRNRNTALSIDGR